MGTVLNFLGKNPSHIDLGSGAGAVSDFGNVVTLKSPGAKNSGTELSSQGGSKIQSQSQSQGLFQSSLGFGQWAAVIAASPFIALCVPVLLFSPVLRGVGKDLCMYPVNERYGFDDESLGAYDESVKRPIP